MKHFNTVVGTFFILVCISMFIPTSFGVSSAGQESPTVDAVVVAGDATINSPSDIDEYLQEVYGK